MQLKLIRRRCLIVSGILLLWLGGLARSAYADSIRVEWDPNPVSENVIGYEVYIGTQSGIYTQEVDAGNALSFTFTDAVAGQRYYFALAAKNVDGTVGPLSTEASGAINAPPVLIAPSDQTNVVGRAITPLQLMGSDPEGPVTYTATGLPPGLTLQESTGLITGTGTTIGVFTVTATVLDNAVPPLTDPKIFTWTMAVPAVVLTPDPATLGTTLIATVSNGWGINTDWLGLYTETGADNQFIGWCYLNGMKIAPATGMTSATPACLTPTAPGRYQARLFKNNGFEKVATSNTITVPGPSVILTPDPATLGTTLTAAVSSGPGNQTDWLGLYAETGADTAFIGWCYLNGAKIAPATGMTSATPACLTPTTPGRYQVRLFSNNTFTKIATSNTITVPVPPGPSVILTPDPATPGTTLTAAVTGGPGNAKDWLGLVPETAADTAYVAWCYLNGTKTPPASGLTSATPTCLMPTLPGRYQVRLFSNNTFTRVATSNTITVSVPTVPTVVLTPDPATVGTMLTETVLVGPGNLTDWMGLFRQGAADTAYLNWCYLNGTKTPPAAGMTSAVVACVTPPASGRYEMRLFSNNTFTRVATSNTITVP